MPVLPQKYNWGAAVRNDNPELVRQLDDIYTGLMLLLNTKPSTNVTNVNPPNNVTAADINRNYSIGDFWVNTSTDTAWIMTSRTDLTTVNWQQIT